ncbi:TolC family protein [Aquimarina celericrescens]|nr:TolC family protein [Aquimarina celericrescens]
MKTSKIKQRIQTTLFKSLILLPFFTLYSCFVAKDYVQPDVSIQETYRGFDAKDSLTIGKIPWKKFFKDEILHSFIQKALDSNFNIRIAYQNILKAEALYKRGKARFLPAIGLNASVTSSDFARNSAIGQQFSNIGDQGSSNTPNRIEQYDATVSASWEADIWGRITSLKNAEYASFLEADASYRAIQTRLVADIALSYYQLQIFDEQLALAKRTVRTRENSLQTIKQLKESGQTTAVAVKQNESQLLTAKILVIEVEQQVGLLENTLSVLLGKAPSEISRNALDHSNLILGMQIGVPSQLLRNRPDIIQAEYELIKTFQLTNASQASFYPRITLTAEAGFQSLAFDNWFNSDSFFNNLIAGLTQPIFNRREIKTQFEVQQAEQRSVLLNFKSTVIQAQKEVSDALISYFAEGNKFKLRKEQVAALGDAEKFSNTLLANGYANYLEVLRATDEKLAVEIELLNTLLAIRQSEVELYKSLGGGWRIN